MKVKLLGGWLGIIKEATKKLNPVQRQRDQQVRWQLLEFRRGKLNMDAY